MFKSRLSNPHHSFISWACLSSHLIIRMTRAWTTKSVQPAWLSQPSITSDLFRKSSNSRQASSRKRIARKASVPITNRKKKRFSFASHKAGMVPSPLNSASSSMVIIARLKRAYNFDSPKVMALINPRWPMFLATKWDREPVPIALMSHWWSINNPLLVASATRLYAIRTSFSHILRLIAQGASLWYPLISK